MKDIIILRHEPLNKHTHEIYLIDELTARGFNLYYWDISQLCFPGMVLFNEIQIENGIKISSLEGLDNKLKSVEIANSVFIVDIFENWANRDIFMILKKYSCFCVRLDLFADSILPIPRWKYFNFTMFDMVNFTSKAARKILYSFYKKKHAINPYQLYITTAPGTVAAGQAVKAINHPDFIKSKLPIGELLVKEKYAVFLDEYFPFHPDLEHLLGIKSTVEEGQEYISKLNNFFSTFEKESGLKVVVAAHPKSNYEQQTFGNRQIFIHQTRELVFNAEMVLAHGSSSINYAVLFKKPVLFLFTNTYFKKYRYLYLTTAYHAQILNSPLINIEEDISGKLKCSLDLIAYDHYKYHKLTSPDCEYLSNSEIIGDVINSHEVH